MSALHHRGPVPKNRPALFFAQIPKIPVASPDPIPLFTPVNHAPTIFHRHPSPLTPLFLVAPLCPF
jgi:hypothetical protein